MKAVASVVAVSVVILLSAIGGDAAPPKANKAAGFMRLKLEESQQLLEALALENFDDMSRHSQKIALLTEDENWMVLQTLEYRQHSEEFRRAANAVTAAAEKKNLDGAFLAYMQMTMNCVQCHKHVRAEAK